MLTCKLDFGDATDRNQATDAFTGGTVHGLRVALPHAGSPVLARSSATLHQIPGGVSPSEGLFRLIELDYAGPVLAHNHDLVGPLVYRENVVSELVWRGRLADLPRDTITIWIDPGEP